VQGCYRYRSWALPDLAVVYDGGRILIGEMDK
jgi:hypothetical protein